MLDEITEQERILGMLQICAALVLADEDVIAWIAELAEVPPEIAAAAMKNISELVVGAEEMEACASEALVIYLSQEWDEVKTAIRRG